MKDILEKQENYAYQPTKEVLDITLIQMVIPINIQGNVSKIKPAKKNVENVVEKSVGDCW